MNATLEGLASGELTLADLGSIPKTSIDALSVLGRSAFETGRFEQALVIFRGLEALEGSEPEHSLRRAHVEIRLARIDDAVASLDRYLSHPALGSPVDAVRALLLRAALLRDKDADQARRDVMTAHLLAERSEAARQVLKAGGR